MSELTREQKMQAVLYAINNCIKHEVVCPVCFLSIELADEMPDCQVTQLLDILQNKYKCIKYSAEPVYKNEEEATEGIFDCGLDEQIDDEIDFQKEINRFLAQRKYLVTPLDNFQKVFSNLSAEVNTVFRLHIEMGRADTPILYVNETPIRKFQNSSYIHKLMKLALGLPNGSTVPIKEVLSSSRRDRGCSQDLVDIFRSSALKAVFTREIKKDSFKIYHHITVEDLKNNKTFQLLKAKEGALSDTIFLAEKVESSRISI